jgi:hypothetical protein
MDIHDFLAHLNRGEAVEGGSEIHRVMHAVSQEALKLTSELNGSYHTPEEIRELFSRLIGRPVDENAQNRAGKSETHSGVPVCYVLW